MSDRLLIPAGKRGQGGRINFLLKNKTNGWKAEEAFSDGLQLPSLDTVLCVCVEMPQIRLCQHPSC